MAGIRIAKVAKVVKSSGPTLPGFHKEWNGKGGFKPGNKYGAKSHGDAAPVAGQGRLDFGAKPDPVKLPDSVKPVEPPKIPNVDFDSPKYKEYAKNQDENNQRIAKSQSRIHEKDPSVYLEHAGKSLKDMVDAGDHYIRIDEGDLVSVLGEGRFKSQFESRKSNGSYNVSLRNNTEYEKIGISKSIEDEQRPIYGYVSGKNFSLFGTNSEQKVGNYGKVSVKLKPSIRDRSTITASDSLESDVVARSAHNPDHLAANGMLVRLHSLHENKDLTPHEKLAKFTSEDTPYIESQYHGGVSAHDIDEVAFSNEPSEIVKNLLKRHGIKHRVISPK